VYILIDNYDSFTYNLYQYLAKTGGPDFIVRRNDRITVDEIEKNAPEGIIISPGPGRPENAGICVDVVRRFAGKIPILGICLGHQVIGYAFGARIVGARRIVHGKTEKIALDGKGLFRNIPAVSRFTRYHSLVIKQDTLPSDLEVTAVSGDGEIMGVRHREHTVEGIQFHPESIASEYGEKILHNFLNYKRKPFDLKASLVKLVSGKDLTENEAASFMEELTRGELSSSQIAAVLVAMMTKNITSRELSGFASVLKREKKCVSFSGPVLDTCGTGGDETGSFNISSMAALVAAACGASVAKHGNRGVSSKSGSADFFRAMGIAVDISPEHAKILLRKTGFTFLFAPIYHGSMKHAAEVRRELGIKTVMNLLGPLVNPADAEYQLIGVFSTKLSVPMAEAAQLMGKKRVMTVCSLDGFDEISVSAPTRVVLIEENGKMKDYIFDPLDLGVRRFPREELMGGDPEYNARIAESLLNSEAHPAIKEAVALNAGAALFVYSLAESIKDGYRMACNALESGRVRAKIQEIRSAQAVFCGQREEKKHA
jgi:anthranilate synthase/phosphoribosyltransferase